MTWNKWQFGIYSHLLDQIKKDKVWDKKIWQMKKITKNHLLDQIEHCWERRALLGPIAALNHRHLWTFSDAILRFYDFKILIDFKIEPPPTLNIYRCYLCWDFSGLRFHVTSALYRIELFRLVSKVQFQCHGNFVENASYDIDI